MASLFCGIMRLAEEEGISGVKLQERVKAVLHYDVHTSTLADILKGKSKWMEARSLVSCRQRGTAKDLLRLEEEM